MLISVENFINLTLRVLANEKPAYGDLAELILHDEQLFRLRYIKELMILLRAHEISQKEFAEKYDRALLIANRLLPPKPTLKNTASGSVRSKQEKVK